MAHTHNRRLKSAILWVAILNGLYFFVEFGAGLSTESVSLIADSIDFLEDASLNILILVGIGFAAAARARLGMFLAILVGIPAVVALLAVIDKFINPAVPQAQGMSIAAFGALVVNATAAFILVRVRDHENSLVTAAWLSARNDVLANLAIIGAAGATLGIASQWWDVAVGIVICYLNADAAVKVWRRSRRELEASDVSP
jgi:Co/Zn/Cd efflux system component